MKILACLLFALSVHADVKLGPEAVISPIGPPAPTIDRELGPNAASAGGDFLAVWQTEVPSGTVALRVREDAAPVAQYPHRVLEGLTHGLIASDGSGYLLAWSDNFTAYTIGSMKTGSRSRRRAPSA